MTPSLYIVGKSILETEGPPALRRFRIEQAYMSHHWISVRTFTDYGTGFEHVRYCDACGCEYGGDPIELDNLDYPFCE